MQEEKVHAVVQDLGDIREKLEIKVNTGVKDQSKINYVSSA